MTTPVEETIAYFSMEIAADEAVPTYSGGLGVLAGDHLRAAADLGLPLVGVTLVYHGGYFRQELGADGHQQEDDAAWNPADRLELLPTDTEIEISGRRVRVRAWRLSIMGSNGHEVPVYFLDTRDEANHPDDLGITDRLYATGPATVRLRQEAVLGLAGVALLHALGHRPAVFHMNEGHAALVPVGVLRAEDNGRAEGLGHVALDDVAGVRSRSVFTTHTPVAAGHDRFSPAVVDEVLGATMAKDLMRLGAYDGNELNMTELAVFFSRSVNAVSRRHGEVTRSMLPGREVGSVTNGVHVPTWTLPATQDVLDRHVDGWRADPALLRYASSIPLDELQAVHRRNKEQLLEQVGVRSDQWLDPDALTLCVARRAAAYKRTDLLLSDPDALRRVAALGPLQVLYAGKAHPADGDGKAAIVRVFERARLLAGDVRVVYLADYDMRLARLLCGGSDVWVNTPVPPYEASGTSGMKAAVNAVPSLSTLDGWWLEGHVEGVTGWAIDAEASLGESGDSAGRSGSEDGAVGDPRAREADAAALYRALHDTIAPLYHGAPEAFTAVGRGALALNGSFFNARRMVSEYAQTAYVDAGRLAVAANRSS